MAQSASQLALLFGSAWHTNSIAIMQALGHQSGGATPVGSVTPAFIGQEYYDTVGKVFYRAVALTNTDWVALAASENANDVIGVGAGYKLARGVHQQVAAVDTVATGLTTVVAVIAQFQDGPTVKQMFVSCSIGDQNGAPVAGSMYIKTWKPTSNVNDSTPTAATDFTDNLKINWIALGT